MTTADCSWRGHPRDDHTSYEHFTDGPALTRDDNHVCGGCTSCYDAPARRERVRRADRHVEQLRGHEAASVDASSTDRAEVSLAADWFDGLASVMHDQYELPSRLRNQIQQSERLGMVLARRVAALEGELAELQGIVASFGQTTPIGDGVCIWCGTEQDVHLARSQVPEDSRSELLRAGSDREQISWHEVICSWLAAWHRCQ